MYKFPTSPALTAKFEGLASKVPLAASALLSRSSPQPELPPPTPLHSTSPSSISYYEEQSAPFIKPWHTVKVKISSSMLDGRGPVEDRNSNANKAQPSSDSDIPDAALTNLIESIHALDALKHLLQRIKSEPTKANIADVYDCIQDTLHFIQQQINHLCIRPNPETHTRTFLKAVYDRVTPTVLSLPKEELGKLDIGFFNSWSEYFLRDRFDSAKITKILDQGELKREAAKRLAESNRLFRQHQSTRKRLEGELNTAKQLLKNHMSVNPDDIRHKPNSLDNWINQKNMLEARLEKLKAQLQSLTSIYEPAFLDGIEVFKIASFEEDAFLHDLIQEAIIARDFDEQDYYLEALIDARMLLEFFCKRDQHILHQITETVTHPNASRPIEKSLWDNIGNVMAKPFKEGVLKREKILRISEIFASIRSDNGSLDESNAAFRLPGALPLDPYNPEELLDYENQVTSRGLTAVYVPAWNNRVILPLDLDRALEESNGETLYAIPGTGTELSLAFSNITPAMDVSRSNKHWKLTPFLIDPPFHGTYSPQHKYFGVLYPHVMNWHLNHLTQLKTLTGKKPNIFARSSGALTAIEIARYYPDFIRAVLAESPPAPTADWQLHMRSFFNGLQKLPKDLMPNLGNEKTRLGLNILGLAWFGGIALAKHVAQDVLGREVKDHDFPFFGRGVSLRLQYKALNSPLDPSETKVPVPVLILYGADDTIQYPDREEDFSTELAFPNLPLNRIWKTAERHYPHIQTLGLPGGHLRFPVDHPTLRKTSREIARLFYENPSLFDRRIDNRSLEKKLPENLSQHIEALKHFRKFKLRLHYAGISPNRIVSEGSKIIKNHPQIFSDIAPFWPVWNPKERKFENTEFMTYLKHRRVI